MGASAKDLSEGGSEEKRRRKKMVHTETKKEEKTNNDLGGASSEQRQCVGSDVMQRALKMAAFSGSQLAHIQDTSSNAKENNNCASAYYCQERIDTLGSA